MDRFNRKISQSLFYLSLSGETRREKMTTRMTEGCETVGYRPLFSRLAARGFDARSSRARAAPSLNLKKKRDCSQSITFRARGAGVEEERKKFCKRG